MIVSLTLVRYRRIFIPFALLAMALHRLPLAFTHNCSFWKLLGCGQNGTFDLKPDWQQWGLLAVWSTKEDFDRFYNASFIAAWWNLLAKEKWTVLCEPLSSHGKWSGKEPFKVENKNTGYNGPVAVLTRASIRFRRLKNFWKNVDPVARIMASAHGYITSIGIGEAPFFLQATFSVWQNADAVKAFAYGSDEHRKVIQKTREENWYSEELFARFKPLASFGTLYGTDPLGSIPEMTHEFDDSKLKI